MLGLPIGLISYYAVLRRQVAIRRVVVIVGGSLLVGCLLGSTTFSGYRHPVSNNRHRIREIVLPVQRNSIVEDIQTETLVQIGSRCQ